MNLPSYPGQPEQPEKPGQPEQPTPPPAQPTPPPPPPYPQAPSYPGGGAAVPPGPPAPPAPPGGTVPPPFPPYQPYGGANDGSASYSAVAIASFVCGLTCCLGIPAVILGAIGIAKTGAGKARGRWMAVTGIVLGVLGTLLMIAVGLGLFAIGNRVVTPDNAEVGQCVAVDTQGDTVTMLDIGCNVPHNGQIFAVLTPTQADVTSSRTAMELCLTRVAGSFPGTEGRVVEGEARLDLDGEEVQVSAVGEQRDLVAGSAVVCWIEATDGELTGDHLD